MAKSGKTYKYSVEVNLHAVDAPGTRLTTKNDIYINICLLGIHKRTRLMLPNLPMHIDQRFYFDKIFKSCHDPRDIIERLGREHVLIELLQLGISSPIVLARYETSAKDFLYPYSYDRVQYTGLRRYILLNRTIDFPGVSPSLEFSVSPSIDDVTGIKKVMKTRKQPKPIPSHGKSPKRAKSPVWKPASAHPPNRSTTTSFGNVSRSLTSHTISSAVKNDYAHRETQEKLRELAIPGEVKYVVPIDKTAGRRPFVVRHVNENLIGRQPVSHVILNDGLVVNDYSLSRMDSSMSLSSLNGGTYRSRSISPGNNRNINSARARTRSPSASRRYIRTSQSVDCERRRRSPSSQRRSNLRSSTTRLYDHTNCHQQDNEFHSIRDCAICRLHHLHSEQSRKVKSLEQRQFDLNTKQKYYSSDIYTNDSPLRPVTSATLVRNPFRYRYQRSPAGELSDKVIKTLRRNLESYNSQPLYPYYSASRYSDGHAEDDELIERSRRLTQD